MTMPFPQLTPVEAVMADLGMMVRRSRSGTLTETEFVTIAVRLRHGLDEPGLDPDGILRARVEMLIHLVDQQTLTKDQFEQITSSIRVRLCERRCEPLTVVPNFAVLPHGVHGRRIGRLTVIDGGVTTPTEPTLKGA